MMTLPANPFRALADGAFALVACVALAGLSASAAAQADGAGVVTHLSGTLTASKADGASRLLAVKSAVRAGETLATQANTYARIKFGDGGEVVLRPNSQLAVDAWAYRPEAAGEDKLAVNLVKGGMRMVTGALGKRSPDKVQVETPTATIGIRGTHFGALMCQNDCADVPTVSGQPPANGLHVDVAAGAVSVQNPAGSQLLSAGQFGYVQSAQTPPVQVPPTQGAPVTMPPNISRNNTGGRSVDQSGQASECAVQ